MLLTSIEALPYLFEYPRASKSGTSHHNGIYAITFKGVACSFSTGYIPITNDGNGDAGVVLNGFNQTPVGLTGIHLASGASVNGERLYTAVLQLLSKVCDDKVLLIPS